MRQSYELHAVFRSGSTISAALLFPHIPRRVAQHHDQRLVIHPIKDVIHAPAGRRCNLPHEAERAMGTLIPGS